MNSCGNITIINKQYLWDSKGLTFHHSRALLRYIKLLILVKRCQRNNVTIGDVFYKYVTKHPNKPCFVFEDKDWSFKEVTKLMFIKTLTLKLKSNSIAGARIFESRCKSLSTKGLQEWRGGRPLCWKPTGIRMHMAGFVENRRHCCVN